ncbi:sugar-transfer associated ATP-grasp domain-containing protein [Thiohalophilus thiocyanatoxydans]|uniref:Putative polysaccharide biosynthesis protein n=1 Tax=Thiohalophilus thiocyanatoxydans TaxID=381308 RepID=A0A4V3H4M9_9GAMM|nr:sugar-transfer associated ATP-grasp domain-containing protein [Thiohalophilus thiocyanatoxydans]TDY03805.1 putative polysaccharide biosynthesis protein [Thiohalophilus thiocyanatoxydans]
MNKISHKLRILGSGFTQEEYKLYRFDLLDNPDEAMRFLSNRHNHALYRPVINRGDQQHILEDKWIAQSYLMSMQLPVPKTYGLYDPVFGTTISGAPMNSPQQVAKLIEPELPQRVFLKPRGGRKGRNVIMAELHKNPDGNIGVLANETRYTLDAFLQSLPQNAFGDYDGCYHGWLIQAYIPQHDVLNHINPHTINTVRVVTFIDSQNQVHVQHAILRLGRKDGVADNWAKGGISVSIDTRTGRLGRGVFKPHYGGAWVSEHPDTGACFEGQTIPEWQTILDVCKRAAMMFSGTRSTGWDIALTPDGPVIIEGNAAWDLPMVQVHTTGYLNEQTRAELGKFSINFPDRVKPLPLALLTLFVYQWRRSRGPRILHALKSRLPRAI